MVKARSVAFICGLLAAAVGVLASDDPTAALLGRWRSLATSRGGIGAMFEFRKGGIVVYSPGAVVEMPYRIEANQLVLPSSRQGGPEQRETITWLTKDRIRLRSAEAPEPGEELVRKGTRESSISPILGEWAGSRNMGGHQVDVLYFFYPGGKSLLLIPFVKQSGNYTLTNGTIHFALPGGPAGDSAFKVENGVLTLTTNDSQETKYARY